MVSLKDYQKVTPKPEWDELLRQAEQFKGKRIVFVNSTPRGGGVALMRHALIRLFRLMEVDSDWFVMSEDQDVFAITKRKFHNVLQGVSGPSEVLMEADKKLFNDWSEQNANKLKQNLSDADVIVIDDPQPSGLIPFIRKWFPDKKVVYRSHTQIDSAKVDQIGTPQHTSWQFIWQNIEMADLFVFHPVPEFVPANVPQQKVITMPATTDPLDGLNKDLSKSQIEHFISSFNKLLNEDQQTPLDPTRDYVTQIARFDPSKGIPDVITAYRQLLKLLPPENSKPQLVIAGHTSVDDPDVHIIYKQIRELAAGTPDIKVLKLPHIDEMFNALLRQSKVVLQLSHKEGFEIKVTEALMKGKPVVSYDAGGIPLQIIDGKTGFIVPKVGDTLAVAQYLRDLLINDALYARMSKAALENKRHDLLTQGNALRWLELGNKLLN